MRPVSLLVCLRVCVLSITGAGLSFWNSDGSVNTTTMLLLSRTYAQSVSGTSLASLYRTNDGYYSLQYAVLNNTLSVHSGVTEIYFNENLNPNYQQFKIVLNDTRASYQHQPKSNRIEVYSNQMDNGDVLHVEIIPQV